jgi:hypothetical protein
MSRDSDMMHDTVEHEIIDHSTVEATNALDVDPFDDALDAELRARAPWLPSKATLALGGAVLVVAGFIGGVLVQKTVNPPAAASPVNAATGPGGFARNGQGAGAGGGQGPGQGTASGGSNATTGTVKLVDGTTIYLTDSNGEIVTVKTTGTTTVRTEQTTALKDIPVGATIAVVGITGADGTFTATQITAQK